MVAAVAQSQPESPQGVAEGLRRYYVFVLAGMAMSGAKNLLRFRYWASQLAKDAGKVDLISEVADYDQRSPEAQSGLTTS